MSEINLTKLEILINKEKDSENNNILPIIGISKKENQYNLFNFYSCMTILI